MSHPANAGLRKVLEKMPQGMRGPAVALPGVIKDPYYSLGAHPDLVARLWDELGKALPEDCRAVFYGNPALVHPRTGVVFGFAMGTHTYALRLPEAERIKALAAGAARVMRFSVEPAFDLGPAGEEWVFCGWKDGEEAWARAAYDHAEDTGEEWAPKKRP
ncbi:MAG: hypothetical protein AAB412_00200 [Elusimicrobiota bacterium]